MKKINKKIILIDGMLYIYRSYYRYLNLNKNKSISAIYGMYFLIKKIIYKYNPSYLLIVLDSPYKNFRKILFEEYKKNRKKTPIDLINQIYILNKIINDLKIPKISIPSIESDDIIGTISKQAVRNNFNVIIITSDKDMIQLISKKIKILDIFSYKEKIFNKKNVYKKYGIYPKYIIDYFSLIGDKTDNIPGIYGIGPKTAIFLLNKYKNINNIYLNINEILNFKLKNRINIIKNLLKNKKNLFLFNKLIKINTDIFIGYSLNEFKIKNLKLHNFKYIINKYNLN